MDWWNVLGKAISSVAEAIGNAVEEAANTVAEIITDVVNTLENAVEDVVNTVSEVITDVVETLGNAVENSLKTIGGVLSGIPIIGGVLGGFFDWLGEIVASVTSFVKTMIKGVFSWLVEIMAGVTNVVSSIIKGVSGIVGGLIGGLIKITGGVIGGLFSGNWSVALAGLIDIATSVVGATLSILGTLASLVQRIIVFQNNERRLTEPEMAMLRIVFQNSISLYDVRLIQGRSGIFGITTTGAFTLNNRIYLNSTNVTTNPNTLVHECVHVWQYQNHGSRYIADALGGQAVYGRTGRRGDAYDWSAELARGNTDWNNFNAEAQASFIEAIWTHGTLTTGGGTPKSGNGAFYEKQDCEVKNGSGVCIEGFIVGLDGIDHTPLAINAVKKLRSYWNFI